MNNSSVTVLTQGSNVFHSPTQLFEKFKLKLDSCTTSKKSLRKNSALLFSTCGTCLCKIQDDNTFLKIENYPLENVKSDTEILYMIPTGNPHEVIASFKSSHFSHAGIVVYDWKQKKVTSRIVTGIQSYSFAIWEYRNEKHLVIAIYNGSVLILCLDHMEESKENLHQLATFFPSSKNAPIIGRKKLNQKKLKENAMWLNHITIPKNKDEMWCVIEDEICLLTLPELDIIKKIQCNTWPSKPYFSAGTLFYFDKEKIYKQGPTGCIPQALEFPIHCSTIVYSDYLKYYIVPDRKSNRVYVFDATDKPKELFSIPVFDMAITSMEFIDALETKVLIVFRKENWLVLDLILRKIVCEYCNMDHSVKNVHVVV